MPVKTQETTRAAQVRPGQELAQRGAKITRVRPMKVNTKIWVEGESEPLIFKLDDLVIVNSYKPTEEELEEQKRAFAYRTLLNDFRSARSAFTRAREHLMDALDAPAYAGLRGSVYEDIIESQALLAIWDRVDHLLKVAARNGAPITLHEAVVQTRVTLVTGMVESYDNPLSRSTRVLSNVVEDAQRGAALKFIRDLKFKGLATLTIE